MAMKTYDFAYGRGRKTFTVEEDRVLKVVRTEEFPPMEDIRGGVLEAIRHPIGCPSIEEIVKPGDTVAFICNDPTRVANSFDFMPVLVDEMNRLGVMDEDMKIVFALGTHRAMTHEEMVEGVAKTSPPPPRCTTASARMTATSNTSARPPAERPCTSTRSSATSTT